MNIKQTDILLLFWGKVREGNKRGRELGFPTLNIPLSKKIIEGVYISKTKIDKKWYPSITFIGNAKTFNERVYQSETYILNTSKNLYDTWLSIRLIKHMRGNKKFNTKEELIVQMKKDKRQAEQYFKEHAYV